MSDVRYRFYVIIVHLVSLSYKFVLHADITSLPQAALQTPMIAGLLRNLQSNIVQNQDNILPVCVSLLVLFPLTYDVKFDLQSVIVLFGAQYLSHLFLT